MIGRCLPWVKIPAPLPTRCSKAAEKEARGKLKIFLGAAPGVGKTYEMLPAARRRRKEGVDVVVGVVETHGRAETEAQLAGLEVLPRRKVEYRGRTLEEMDLDAILQRRPALVLVDELAHTNAPGSRHPKRYLDVEELLAAGIDVYSTLNVQHVESLNDVVAQITRIRVRETVPDSHHRRADEVELVDLTPAELMERLREGKVYVREQAQRALRHYFSPGNLTALRELALRRTAERVDAQMLTTCARMPSPAPGRRASACWSASIPAPPRRRGARRQAHRRRARCRADRALCRDRSPRRAVRGRARPPGRDHAAGRAELGAEVVTVPGRAVVEEVLAFAARATPRASWSASRGARAGSSCATARWSTSWCAAARGSPSRWRRRAAASKAATPTDGAQRAAHAWALARGRAHDGAGDGGSAC